MIVCLCHGVSDREVDAVVARGASTLEAVARACGAGTSCGSCVCALSRKLSEARAERSASRAGSVTQRPLDAVGKDG